MAADTLESLRRDLLNITRRDYPSKVKGMLRKAGNKLKRKTVSIAKSQVSEKTGNYLKGFKRGKPYKYQGEDDCIRVYNGSPHAHLIEYGHRQTDKAGNDYGYTPGKHILENAEREYVEEFNQDVEAFIDGLLEDGDLA